MKTQTKRKRPVAWKLLDEDSELIRVPIRELSPELLGIPSCFEVHGFDKYLAECPACGSVQDEFGLIVHRKPEDWTI